MTREASDGSGRTQPWIPLAVAGFLLNWVWEMLQAPLYGGMLAMSPLRATWLCTKASAGDGMIALFAYAVIAAAIQNRAWLTHPRRWDVAAYLAVGLVISTALEILSVQHWGRWSYTPSMPRLLGVGIAPLAQWIVVPLVTLWVVKRYG